MAAPSHHRRAAAPALAALVLWGAAVGLALLPAVAQAQTPTGNYTAVYNNGASAALVSVYLGSSYDSILTANGGGDPVWFGSATLAATIAKAFGDAAPANLATGNTWFTSATPNVDPALPGASPGPWFCFARTNNRLSCLAYEKSTNLFYRLQQAASNPATLNVRNAQGGLVSTHTAARLQAVNAADYVLIAYGIDTCAPGVCADPHVLGFNGAPYAFADGPEFQGHAYALMSSARTALNALVERHAGGDEFPAAGSWLTGFGLRVRGAAPGAAGVSLLLRMKTSSEYKLIEDKSKGKTRALHPDGPKGRLAALFEAFEVNGRPSLDALESGRILEFPESGVTIHLPATRHANDPTDGPVAIISTPDMDLQLYLESEDIWHLDFKVALKNKGADYKWHGILGQSVHWAHGASAEVEGGDLDYVLPDGLLGTEFRYSRFGRDEAPAAKHETARRLLQGDDITGPMVAGSVAALQA